VVGAEEAEEQVEAEAEAGAAGVAVAVLAEELEKATKDAVAAATENNPENTFNRRNKIWNRCKRPC